VPGMEQSSHGSSREKARMPERAWESGDEWLCGFVGGPTTSLVDQPPKGKWLFFPWKKPRAPARGFFTRGVVLSNRWRGYLSSRICSASAIFPVASFSSISIIP
jgi:hypothetical protein